MTNIPRPPHNPISTSRCLPFGPDRIGIVPSEGSGAIVIEKRRLAVRRGAKILGRLAGRASRCCPMTTEYGGSREAIGSAAKAALADAGVTPRTLNHVCAQGFSERQLDIEESQAIAAEIGSRPVSAYSSYLGTAGAGCGILELICSLVAMDNGLTLPVSKLRWHRS